MQEDIGGQVAAYRGLVESSARRFASPDRPRADRAEYDDLVQEGLIAVWVTLRRGLKPSASFIEQRMLSWMRLVGAQTGKTKGAQHFDYEDLLPLDGLRVVQPQE